MTNDIIIEESETIRRDLAQIFDRVSVTVNLQGVRTPGQLRKLMMHRIVQEKIRAKRAKIKVIRDYMGYCAEQDAKLVDNGFPNIVINEANRHPKGLIYQTLLYGRDEAIRRIQAQKRAEVRAKLGFKIKRGKSY